MNIILMRYGLAGETGALKKGTEQDVALPILLAKVFS